MAAARSTARGQLAGAVACALVLLVGSAGSAASAPTAVPVLVFDGRGHGHGVGLAQDSANSLAAAGATYEQILTRFYPGTRRGSRSGILRVAVWEGAGATAVDVALPQGGRVSGSGGTMAVPAGTALRVSYDGSRYRVRQVPGGQLQAREDVAPTVTDPTPLPVPVPTEPSPNPPSGPSPRPSSSPTAGPSRSPAGPAPVHSARPTGSPAPGPRPSSTAPVALDSSDPVTFAPAAGGVTTVAPTGRSYRGTVVALARSGFRLVNHVDVETYLRGLGEVPSGWPMAALSAQAVAARTYALRAAGSAAPLGFDLCDDDRCQVYLGAQRENARSNAATEATRGEVVIYRGGLADTFFSANAGGRTASTAEGFGSSSAVPYLPSAVAAPGPLAPWHQTAATAAVAARLGYPGALTDLTVTARGPSGRVTRVRLLGTVGPREISGVDLASKLGLWSTLFSVRRSTGVAEALPAAKRAIVQLAPEVAAAAPPEPAVASPSTSSAPAVRAEARDRAERGHIPLPTAAIAVALIVGAAVATSHQARPIGRPTKVGLPWRRTNPSRPRRSSRSKLRR